MGLSLTIGNMLGLISQSFFVRNVPAMAKAAARKDWTEMDHLFRRSFWLFCIVYLISAMLLMAFALLFGQSPFAARILPAGTFAGLLVALFAGQLQAALAMQLRSFRREPLVWISIAGAAVTATLSLIVAQPYGASAVVVVMVAVQLILVLPLSIFVFVRCNRLWRLN
jgi:O-antigen/teichoic acid export membrane protein